LIGVKPEIIQGAPANRVGVLVLRQRFAVPSYGISRLGNSPWCAAVTLVVKRAVVCPAWFLRGRMKPDVTDIDPGSQRYAKRSNGPIEVLVIERVFVMINASRRVGHLVTHKPNPVVARVGFDLVHSRAGPCHNCRLHSHRRADTCKRKICRATADRKLTPGSVVIHVALPWMRLAPCVFVRRDVLGFAEIGRARIQCRVQVVHCHGDPM